MISYAYIYNISSKVFKNIAVINYFTFLNFHEGKQGQVISPHFTDEVTGYHMTILSMSLGQFQSICQIFFFSFWTSTVFVPWAVPVAVDHQVPVLW